MGQLLRGKNDKRMEQWKWGEGGGGNIEKVVQKFGKDNVVANHGKKQ